jgi:hypothetical protein
MGINPWKILGMKHLVQMVAMKLCQEQMQMLAMQTHPRFAAASPVP